MDPQAPAVDSINPPPHTPSDLKADVVDNPAVQRALRRLRESQSSDNHVSHYTKHSSHAVKHSSSW